MSDSANNQTICTNQITELTHLPCVIDVNFPQQTPTFVSFLGVEVPLATVAILQWNYQP
jgi:hypothetical protein